MSKKILELADKLKSKIYSNYNAGKHTWFRTGGNARIFAIIEDNFELEIILNEINNENFYIIGSGSNLLIRDYGYNGTLIKLGKAFNTININENKLEVGASILDINLSNYALRQNIEGFEFYSGIPGSIGGAVKMNAGCYGSETVDVINSIEICDNFGQRKTITKDNPRMTIRLKKKYESHIPIIVIDKDLKIPMNTNILKDISKKRIIIFTSKKNKKSQNLSKLGCEIIFCKLEIISVSASSLNVLFSIIINLFCK